MLGSLTAEVLLVGRRALPSDRGGESAGAVDVPCAPFPRGSPLTPATRRLASPPRLTCWNSDPWHPECGCTSEAAEEAGRVSWGLRCGARPAWPRRRRGGARGEERRGRRGGSAARPAPGASGAPASGTERLRGCGSSPPALSRQLEQVNRARRALPEPASPEGQAGWPPAAAATAGPSAAARRPRGVPRRLRGRTAALQHRAGFCPTPT